MAIKNPAQRQKAIGKTPGIPTRVANPTGTAGSKNSNGAKGGSSKGSVPANRDSNTTRTSKVSRSTPKNNPHQMMKSSKSERIDYAKLKIK